MVNIMFIVLTFDRFTGADLNSVFRDAFASFRMVAHHQRLLADSLEAMFGCRALCRGLDYSGSVLCGSAYCYISH